MGADARIAARDDLRRVGRAGAVGGEDVGNRFGHERLRVGAGPATAFAGLLLCQSR